MNILVSGTSSGLGKYLFRKLPSKKFDRDNPRYLSNEKFDLIIHTASGMPDSNETFEEYHFGQRKVLDNLLELSFEKFIFISSIEAFKEHSESSLYALNKIKLEKIIIQNLRNFLIIRPALLLGPDMRFNQILKIATKSKCKLSLSPESSFNLVYYSDIISIIEAGLLGVINLVSKRNISLKEISKYYETFPNWGDFKYLTPKPSELTSIYSNSKVNSIDPLDRFSKFVSIEGWKNKINFEKHFN